MKPVFPNETRLQRAVAAARVRLASPKDRPQLSSESIDLICEQLLDYAIAVQTVAPAAIEPGRFCQHKVRVGFCSTPPCTVPENGDTHG